VSVTVDANILVYASNTDDPAFHAARDLIERLAAGPDLMYLFWPVIMGYLRIVTHPRILPRPLSLHEAADNLSDLLQRPHVRTGAEGDRFWDIFLATVGRHERGNGIPDAHLVSLMRQYGVTTIYTRDRNFRKYEGITVRDPVP
jgi:toxin-antitoxin system PIN domain toxin